MKNKILKVFTLVLLVCVFAFTMVGCSQADTMKHNIQVEADQFKVYRRMTFVNLYTNEALYSAEGYFSMQTTYDNTYQGQQEIALIFKVGKDEYKMDYFSIANNVTYVIEQLENTTGNPYYWKIVWYVALPDNVPG